MSFCVSYDDDFRFEFDAEEVFRLVAEEVLEMENCPYEAEVDLTITTEEEIRANNSEFRQIDKVTDVLSFPFLEFTEPGVFAVDEESSDEFDPDTGELMLGDIVICYRRAIEQAEEYGHSVKREFAFLAAHSMLHLCGYDHMEDDERVVMEEKQERVLQKLGITREK